ncbi:hypothetical protein OGM63_16535 [Plectonema radiosum NIES-515]|uniref:Uncharacterized protein n=1 Tax=Plectonema radiosum NIES-515 TaxID=2986073 RepID=A0ABT3B281_9CYAN|nr:hypothetical protein [Plectonema radiosum]MCV3215100.1 hypothetical protein [Plectonema radiosum NIES-515]
MTIQFIAVETSSPSSPSATISLQTASIFLGMIVSVSALIGLSVKISNSINRNFHIILQLEKEIKQLSADTERINKLEHRMDLYLLEYENRKDVTQMVLGQLDQKIDHKFKRLLFYSREIQRFLQRDTNFQIREYEETKEDE